ncbi:MAG TPA: hypothetical protein VNQ90_20330 [Chthoniobacteraceae bacterium]|nr:hypothetical protein [Chthoniobacteraceae bacterium]
MNDSFIPLLQFFVTVGEVVGRKKCQKLIHILQECGHDFGFDFKLALYGAYSSGLQARLEDFVDNRYIQEVPEVTGPAGYPTSKFVANRRNEVILKILGQDKEPSWKGLAVALNQRRTRVLEAASTILYLRRGGTRGENLEQKFAVLKPHLTDIFDEGKQLADELRPAS